MGANAGGRPSVSSPPRRARCRTGGDGAAVAGAPPAGRAPLLATAVECSSPSAWDTPTQGAEWTQARGPPGPSGPAPGVGAPRGGGRGGAGNAVAVLPLSPPLARRGSPAVPASGDRGAPDHAGGDRVARASCGVSGLGGAAPCGPARWGAAWGLWATCARHRGPGHGRVAPVAPLDEPGGRAGRTRARVWGAGTAWGPVCVGRLSRGATGVPALLGAQLGGLLVTERWRASPWYPTRWRQVCWAHRLRDCAAMSARGGRAQEMGAARRAQARQRLHGGHRVREGTVPHAEFRRRMRPMRRQGARRRKAGQPWGVAHTAGRCRAMRKGSAALWTFVRIAGVEPTNTTAARAIRPGGLWRTGSLGTQRADGSRCVEAMRPVVATRTPHPRPVLASRTDGCQAADTQTPAPSLLPCCTAIQEALPAVA